MTKPSKIHLGHTELFLREDGIIEAIGSNYTYSPDDIRAIHEAIAKMKRNEREPILFIAQNDTTMDQEARKYLSTPEAGVHAIAIAYVIKTLAQKILINFLIKVSGTPVPVKFFNDEVLAVKWLNSFKNKDE